jgi:hypothetical protein
MKTNQKKERESHEYEDRKVYKGLLGSRIIVFLVFGEGE